jgi:hypothetical protein
MAKKRTGPPPRAIKWLEEYRQGKHRGLTPTPEHYKSIWNTSYIPDRCTPATPEMMDEAEARLGVVIPLSMKKQLLIQNGGCLPDCAHHLFHGASVHWANATVDGIHPVQSWERAKDDNWFESVKDVKSLHLLIRIAAHSEAQFCLDYRKCGPSGIPAVTFIDVCSIGGARTEVVRLTESVDEFIRAIIASRPPKEDA